MKMRAYYYLEYQNEEGLEMVEIHIDERPESTLLTNISLQCQFGYNVSIQKRPEKLLTSIGHEECILQQFIFTESAWSGPWGVLAIIPKDEGNGEAKSATKVNGTTMKKQNNSPIILFFECGYWAGKEGYRTYDHMCLQLEDCVNIIQALYSEDDTIWLFDHIVDMTMAGKMDYLWAIWELFGEWSKIEWRTLKSKKWLDMSAHTHQHCKLEGFNKCYSKKMMTTCIIYHQSTTNFIDMMKWKEGRWKNDRRKTCVRSYKGCDLTQKGKQLKRFKNLQSAVTELPIIVTALSVLSHFQNCTRRKRRLREVFWSKN
jgi:hypothetical protein